MKRLKGFSLMETMVVLSIVAIVAAASAPMVNKKMVREVTDTPLWTRLNGGIGYNTTGTDNTTVSIGTSSTRPDGTNPRLYISTRNNNNTPHMMFGHNGGHLYRFTGGGQNNNIWLSNLTMPQNNLSNTVVLGRDNQVQGSDQVAIGREITANGQSGIAIGRRAELLNTSTRSIAIGSGASSIAANTIALGTEAAAKTSDSIAIGRKAEVAAAGTGAIAIGQETLAASNGVAIGSPGRYGTLTYTTHAAPRAIAIGAAAQAKGQDSISMSLYSHANSDNSIAIGRWAWVENDSSNATAIGGGSLVSMHSSNATAIGGNSGVSANSTNATAVGNNAFVYDHSANSMAIGSRVSVKSNTPNTMAIGQGMTVSKLGANNVSVNTVESNVHKTIVLGDKNTTVVIPGNIRLTGNICIGDVYSTVFVPGNFVVNKTTILGYNNGSNKNADNANTFIRSPQGNDDGDMTLYSGKRGGTDNTGCVWPFYTYNGNIPVSYKNVKNTVEFIFSDRRLKNVGKEFTSGLDKIKKLHLYHYTYKDDTTKTPHVGVIAQDLQKIFPDAVMKGEDGFLRIRMEDMFYALVNAVKELDTRLTTLEQKQKKIDELEKRVDTLEKRLADLEKKVK